MINFHPLTLKDKTIIEDYWNKISVNSYEYLFSSLYLWRNYCNTSYAIIDDVLIIRQFNDIKKTFFMMPYGYKKENLTDLINTLINNSNDDSLYLLGDIEYAFIKDLQNHTTFNIEIIPDINCYEYIYLTSSLIKLTGSKYHKKRNHLNNFIKNYNYSIKSISDKQTISDCLTLIDNWHKINTKSCRELQVERSAIEDLLNNIDNFNLKTIAIYVENSLVGFAIGEKVNNTAVIHIERCDKSYLGSYAFLNREFLIRDFSDTLYVNRQEDCGDEGMRQAKLSYHPHHMIEKYLIKIY